MRRKLTITAVTTAVLMIAAVAFAAWTADGTGNGSATATSGNAVGVSGTVASNLYPTGSFNIDVTITNSNPYKVQVTEVEQNGLVTVDADHSSCNAATVSFAEQTGLTGGSWVVPAKTTTDGSITRTFTGAVSMTNDANNFCQGATFTIPLKAYAASTASSPS